MGRNQRIRKNQAIFVLFQTQIELNVLFDFCSNFLQFLIQISLEFDFRIGFFFQLEFLIFSPQRRNELIDFRYAQSINYIFLCYQNIQKIQGSRLKLYQVGIQFLPSGNWPRIGLTNSYWDHSHSSLVPSLLWCCIWYAWNWNRFRYPDPTILRVIIHAWVECFSFWKYPVWLCMNTIWDIFHIISLKDICGPGIYPTWILCAIVKYSNSSKCQESKPLEQVIKETRSITSVLFIYKTSVGRSSRINSKVGLEGISN